MTIPQREERKTLYFLGGPLDRRWQILRFPGLDKNRVDWRTKEGMVRYVRIDHGYFDVFVVEKYRDCYEKLWNRSYVSQSDEVTWMSRYMSNDLIDRGVYEATIHIDVDFDIDNNLWRVTVRGIRQTA